MDQKGKQREKEQEIRGERTFELTKEEMEAYRRLMKEMLELKKNLLKRGDRLE